MLGLRVQGFGFRVVDRRVNRIIYFDDPGVGIRD